MDPVIKEIYMLLCLSYSTLYHGLFLTCLVNNRNKAKFPKFHKFKGIMGYFLLLLWITTLVSFKIDMYFISVMTETMTLFVFWMIALIVYLEESDYNKNVRETVLESSKLALLIVKDNELTKKEDPFQKQNDRLKTEKYNYYFVFFSVLQLGTIYWAYKAATYDLLQ